MNQKPALLVAALLAAAAVTVGCEQRGASDTVGKRDSSSGSMQAQNTPPGGAASSAPGSTSSDKSADKSAMQPGAPSDKMAANQPSGTTDKSNAAADKIGGAADDAAITAKVKAAILAEPGLKSLSINVDTKAATVTLSGNVASDQLRDRAKQIAMSTEGVKNVVDNLTVKAG